MATTKASKIKITQKYIFSFKIIKTIKVTMNYVSQFPDIFIKAKECRPTPTLNRYYIGVRKC